MSARTDRILDGIARGVPTGGPTTVHVDVTNACNAACVTCWDHSPLLTTARPAAWKKQRLDRARFAELVDDLAALGSVRNVILSGMGDPLVHPDIYEMIARVKAHGWHLTLMTNLIAADIDRLAPLGVDAFLIGVHGATPATYAAFHPGWDEREFFRLCGHLRRLHATGAQVRHVQVINRDTAAEVPAMVRFGGLFKAARVNFKLASLAGGTEACRITDDQRAWLRAEGVPQARALAAELGVATNLDLFAAQLAAGAPMPDLDGGDLDLDADPSATVPIAEVGCFMGHVYTRITATLDVLYCCNTAVRVGSLADERFATMWTGPAWQALRDRLRAGDYFPGCERCGKFEQNLAWRARVRDRFGEDGWRAATGAAARPITRLRVVS
jgi:pyruvate-formate lyase-activating enzyme